ncbi:UBP8-like protein [Mya arenaria]|uniref:ubiquitinyl hydrolase 1 n=1 Tax=Mya arenaria TaxID=6604 RepID=A0ABY7G8U6_MYAAR|nr:UBP8-like protein [Mya arenaria]
MPVSAKKDGAKKGLYIAKSMSELNKMAELPAKLKTNNAKILVKTADKMLKEAEHSELMQDEERAYTYYDNLLGSKNLLSAIDNAEQLSGSLKERFDLIEAESVAEKLSSLDKSQDDSGKTKIPGGKGNDVKIDEPQETAKTKPEPTPPAPQSEPGKVTCAQLYTMLQDRDTQMILMDVRPMEDFQDSRINHKAIINVPAGAIKPGTTVTVIEKALPMDSMSLWKQRGNIDHIILLDRNSLDFDYPDFDEEFLKPKQPEQKPQDTVSLSERFSGFQNGEVGMKSTSLPTIDRATKPVVDRSTKANLTKIMVTNDGSKSDSTTSLYPDVRAVSGPGSTVNQNRGFTNTDTRSSSANFSNTDSRSAVRKMTGQSDRISESQSSTSLNKVADELSNELTELDRQKKQREEELAELKRESEKVREESRAERKKREEDTETVKWEEETRRIVERERMEREKREIEEAQKRAKEEEEKKLREIAAAEDRARQLRIEEEKKTMDTKEKHTIEERLRRERELQAQLEKERQAALEERRRLQAEHDRLEAERKEKKRQEKEKQDRERLAQEEADRKLADEARRAADEKLRLMNGPQKGTYTTKLKDDNTTPKRGLSRSNSSPNIAKMFEDEGKSLPEKKIVPSVNRGIKPVEKRILPAPMPAKRRDLNPVYGSMGRALTGLRNLGNTCYMNSTIQCLNNTSPLVTYLLTDTYLYDINRHMNEGELVDDFAYIVKALWSEQYRCITPRDFKRVAGHHQPMFAGYEQQDSQEFLTFLMDGLHEGLNKVKSRPKIPEQNNDNLPDMKAAELAWRDHKLHNESIIVELFQDCLRQFSAEEKLTDRPCPKCKSSHTACCRNPCTNKWYKFDDHEVYDISESSVKTSAAYVLYYTSIEMKPPEYKRRFE